MRAAVSRRAAVWYNNLVKSMRREGIKVRGAGMPTLIETDTPEQCARLCRELGLDFIELNMNLPDYQAGALDIRRFNALAARYHIYYTIHLDENLNVSDFNPYVRQAYLRTVQSAMETAKRLGAPVINMHLAAGVYFTLPGQRVYLFERYMDRYLQSIADFRDACERAAGQSGITVCVENCAGYTAWQKRALRLLLKSPVFALTYDIGHDHASGGKDGAFIMAHAGKLRHMHIHDALGAQDHLALGAGEIALKEYLDLASAHDCRVVLETKTVAGLTQSAAWLREHGF